MPEGTAPTTPTTPEANGSGVAVIPSLEERSAALFGDTPPENDNAESSAANDAAPAAPAEPDEAAKARAERRAALRKLQDEERARVDTMAAISERDELRQKLAALESSQRDRPANLVDVDGLDEEKFYALAEKAKVSPHRFYEWLRERMANPELAAAHAATRVIDPKFAALEKQNQELKARLDAFENAQQQARVDAEERAAYEQFTVFTRENAASSPYSARFLEKHGPAEFFKLARSAVQAVPPHAGAQAVLDEIEERLTQLGAIYVSETGTNQQRRQATTTHPDPAAAKAPIVSNSLAQQRSSVIDEDEQWAALPFEERSARLFR